MSFSYAEKHRDIKGPIAIVIGAVCIVAIVFGYAQAVRLGILYTVYSIPFFTIAIILSALSLKHPSSKRTGIIGLSVGIGGIVASWGFAGIVLMVGLFSGLDSSIDMGFLSLLNWE